MTDGARRVTAEIIYTHAHFQSVIGIVMTPKITLWKSYIVKVLFRYYPTTMKKDHHKTAQLLGCSIKYEKKICEGWTVEKAPTKTSFRLSWKM